MGHEGVLSSLLRCCHTQQRARPPHPVNNLRGNYSYPGGGPLKTGQNWVDPYAGLRGVGATIAALLRREVSGRGQHIDVSMQESTIATLGPWLADFLLNGRLRHGDGNRRPGMVRGAYPTRGYDDWVAISLRDDAEWEAFCGATAHEDWLADPRFATAASRSEHHDALDELVATWTRERTKFEAAELLQSGGVPGHPCAQGRRGARRPAARRPRAVRRPRCHGPRAGPDPALLPAEVRRPRPPRARARTRLRRAHGRGLVEAGIPESEAAAIAAEQGLVELPPGLWSHPEVVVARRQDFADYPALGSVLRIDDAGAARRRAVLGPDPGRP